jgi:hypothetical protein
MGKKQHNSPAGPQTAVGTAPTPPVPQVRGYVYTSLEFDNPLNDSSQATTLLQTNSPSIATPEEFNKQRSFHIYIPKQLATDFVNAPAGSKPKARLSLFFGVGPEMTLFRLRPFFADATSSVLITIPGVERGWTGVFSGFGWGISTQMINDLMTSAHLSGIDFSVEVMAGYSTGYRGVNQTIINQLVDLSNLTRLIYLDAWYHHDDHPLAASASPYYKKNTRWAIDTALGKSPSANVVIYAFTHSSTGPGGGVPRSNAGQTNQSIPDPPSEPVQSLITQYPNKIQFIDFEFKFNTRPAIDDSLQKICLARLIQLGFGSSVQQSAVPPSLMTLINALPDRGSLGTLGFAGYTDLYGWVSSHTSQLSGFSVTQAMAIVVAKNLLGSWTDSSAYEMRHRMFVLELGKEPLLP